MAKKRKKPKQQKTKNKKRQRKRATKDGGDEPGLEGFLLLLGSVAAICCGVWLMWGGVQDIKLSNEVGSWPFTMGVVTHSSVAESWDSEDPPQREYTVKVRYDYSVKGKQHYGDRIRLLKERTSNWSRAERWRSAYPKGKRIRVYYRKGDPAESVLEPTPSEAKYTRLILGLISLIAGSLLGIVCVKAIFWEPEK